MSILASFFALGVLPRRQNVSKCLARRQSWTSTLWDKLTGITAWAQRTLSSQAARHRPDMTSGAAVSAHSGQLTAVGPARAPSQEIAAWRALGERVWPRSQQWRAGNATHMQLHRSAKPGRARKRGRSCQRREAAFTEMLWKGALAGAERAGQSPAHLESVLKLCALASLNRPHRSAAPPDARRLHCRLWRPCLPP
jgi:hypothetical protein